MNRVPELDSLRGLAALIVLSFHLDPRRYFPGWSGVDLFFVLSGYLITAIILREGDSPGFYGRFYARRSLRIWPIYYGTLLALVAVNPYLSRPAPLGSVPYALTFTYNAPAYRGERPPAPHPAFDHAWTLTLEEQFYLVWPALVIGVGRRRLPALCGAVIALALACRAGDNGFLPRYSERLLPARCDGFALGGLLAWALADGGWARSRPDLGRVAFAGASGLALAYLAWGSRTYGALGFIGLPTPMWPAETIFAFGLLYAGLIGLAVVDSGAPWLAPLRRRVPVYLGQISYGLYIYHYVVYWIVDGLDVVGAAQPWPIQALKLAGSLAAASASWFLLERPILRLKAWFTYHRHRAATPTPPGPPSLDSR